MRQLVLALDALPSLRDAIDATDIDLAAAAMLAELAGVDAVRLGINEDLKPVREEDVQEARRAARVLELRMPPSSSLLKVALEAQPDRVVLAAEASGRKGPAGPVDLRGRTMPLEPVVRALGEAGIAAVALVGSDLESVKLAHGQGVTGVEFYTATMVDLPPTERRGELERLGDAVRLASKLRLRIGLGGGLGYRTLAEVLSAAPAAEAVTVGRSALARAVLVGLDRALRDLKVLVR
jgi:pyridoxine 5-phosphate synthase